MSEAAYTKHGGMKDAEPCFMPDARGLLIVTEGKRRVSGEAGALINLHAQRELSAQSSGFAAAQEWWSNLPKTPARHLFNLDEAVADILLAESIAERWAAQFDELDGLAYIFNVARTVNIKTGETQTEPPVFAFSRGGFERLTYPKEKNCLRYHLYFAFYEKPETLNQRVSIGTDSLSIAESDELAPRATVSRLTTPTALEIGSPLCLRAADAPIHQNCGSWGLKSFRASAVRQNKAAARWTTRCGNSSAVGIVMACSGHAKTEFVWLCYA